MKKNFRSGLIVLIVLIVVAAGITVLSEFSPSFNEFSASANPTFNLPSKGTKTVSNYNKKLAKNYKNEYVATIYIEGTIEEENQTYDQKWLLDTIQKLKDDDKNIGLILFIDSPGGAVYQADEVYLALQQYKTTGKKIITYMGSLAASGGYYIACASNEIWANRNTLTGSIGVISGTSYDLTGLFEKMGIKSETIHAGKNKNMGNYNEPLSAEQKAILQGIADECYEQFTGIVATSRDLPLNEVKTLADGRVYTAKQALELKLIDGIDSFDNVVSYFTKDMLHKPGIKNISYKVDKKTSFLDLLSSKASDIADKKMSAATGLPESVLKDINGFNSYPAYIYR